MSTVNALEIKDLRKNFGKTEIIRGINLCVQHGERVADQVETIERLCFRFFRQNECDNETKSRQASLTDREREQAARQRREGVVRRVEQRELANIDQRRTMQDRERDAQLQAR